ncbi:MAG: NAD+ synthase [Elusimicrobiota bacterium]
MTKKSKILRIACAQIDVTVGDLQENSKKIISAIQKAKNEKADLIVFPECIISGYPPEDLMHKGHFVRDVKNAADKITKETQGITAVIGCVYPDHDGKAYNSAVIYNNGRLIDVYNKHELPNYGVFDENRYFTEGGKKIVFEKDGFCFGVTICEDIWVKNGPYIDLAKAGADLILNISASPYYAGKMNIRYDIAKECAKTAKTYLCYCNMIGGQDELVFDGGSFVMNPQGIVISSAKEFEEDLLITDIPLMRKKPKKYGKVVIKHLLGTVLEKKPVKPKKFKRSSEVEEIYKALVLGARDYARKNGFQKAVMGLSGGIDSALVAKIAVDALSSENVICVSMPSKYSSKGTQSDARKLAKNLDVNFFEIPIEKTFTAYMEMLDKMFKCAKPNIAEENLQARIRGNTLMALSNKFGWLVLSTGNKSETAVGYTTLYGDMAGGFAVIKDVKKTLVYKLAEYVNTKSKAMCIPLSVIKRAPSAELRFNQKDQDSLPAYDILDSILSAYVERDMRRYDIRVKGASSEEISNVVNLVDKNEYKRRQAPPGIKITPKAFGRDRRMPITNGYKD